MLSPLNAAFLGISRRAETYDRAQLVATFVDVGALFTLLSNRDHQVLYGRRGTGKTHALYYLADAVEAKGDVSVQLDLRTIGSSGGIYSDPGLPLSERATRLLVDTLSAVHEQILAAAVQRAEELDLSTVGPALDRFADALSEVAVVGPVEIEAKAAQSGSLHEEDTSSVKLTPTTIQLSFDEKTVASNASSVEEVRRQSGMAKHRVHFGSVKTALSGLADVLGKRRVWLLLDEWSEVPLELQPYLADMLRRCILPVRGFSVKIAAIEQRSSFRLPTLDGGHIGIEVGADIAASVNLDDFMVFDNDKEAAKEFFQQLFFKHVRSVLDDQESSLSLGAPADLIRQGFTQRNAFEEVVRAAEGVPRDAINVLSTAAQRSGANPISVPDVRVAAKLWYQRGKENAVASRPEARDLLRWIIDEVIGERKAKAFMLKSGSRHELIDYLFDARVLHVIKHSVSGQDEPGVRYDVYAIDYGCYVDLINTQKAPLGLFEATEADPITDSAHYTDVPGNDYRSIRRTILDLEKFEKARVRSFTSGM